MQIGFYFDQRRCSGCFTCVIACKEWHDWQLGPVDYRRVVSIERGKYPKPFLAYLTTSCLHCADPACVAACPVNAIAKRAEDGIVLIDQDVCLGKAECPGFCKDACPYDAPSFGNGEDAKMGMCDLCADRLAEKKSPVCVNACPMQALEAGALDELAAVHGGLQNAAGFEYSEKVKPSSVFRPKVK